MGLSFYKKGQGYYTRMGTALGGGILAALGCRALYYKLSGIETGETITAAAKTWIQAGVPVVVFAGLGFLIFKIVNSVRCADFMIATEGEMKKVSWSTRKEIIGSTKVVIITVIIMALLLAAVDMGFRSFFEMIGVLKVAAT